MAKFFTLAFLALAGCNQDVVTTPEVVATQPEALTTRGLVSVFASKMVRDGALQSETQIVADFNRYTDGLAVKADEWRDWGCRTIEALDVDHSQRAGVHVSAGNLTLTLAEEPLARLAPRSDQTYARETLGQAWSQPGQTLTVSASGGEVEAFTTGLTVPTRVTIMSAPSDIARSNDATLRWQGGSNGALYVDLGSAHAMVRCRFDARDGGATIPSTTLAELEAGTGWIAAQLTASETLEVGRTLVSVMATYRVVTADGAWFSKPIEIR